jgi:uncharacterized protein (TIGR01732 family)
MSRLSENEIGRKHVSPDAGGKYGPQDAHALIVILFIAAVIIGMAVKITFF